MYSVILEHGCCLQGSYHAYWEGESMGSSDSGQFLLTMKAYDKDFQTLKDLQPNHTAPPQTIKPADTHICAQAHIIQGVYYFLRE